MKRIHLGLSIVCGAMMCIAGVASGQVAHSGVIRSGHTLELKPQPQNPQNTGAMGEVANASNAFALDLFTRLGSANGGNDNLFFSPYSICSALTMARVGAHGPTADEMSTALHLPAGLPTIESGYQAMSKSLIGQEQKDGYTLNVANALWVQKGELILPAYMAVVQNDFNAYLKTMDFIANSDGCRKEINDWVSRKTQQKIKDLLSPDAVTSQTRVVLTDAIFFQGKWAEKFDPAQTKESDFHCYAKQDVKTPMMHASGVFQVAGNEACDAIRLPYHGDHLAMIVLLPKPAEAQPNADRAADPLRRGMENLQGSLSPQFLATLTHQFARRSVRLTLPKWKATESFDLGSTLADMGMKQAFSTNADFSGIDGRPGLFLSAAVHKAFVEVDELGAAAATGAPMSGNSPLPPMNLVVDHPFIYLIVAEPNNTILFAGRMCNPTAK